jgi:hypothetical protein
MVRLHHFPENFTNYGGVFLGDGNDSIIADTDFPNRALRTSTLLGLVMVTT